MQEKIKVSVIIPAYNRKEELKKLLISLEEQTYPKENFEIIIVDNGSTDGTQFLIKEMMSKFKGHLHYISMPKRNDSPVVRNIGVKEARGEILSFIDSDCIAHPDWLKNIVKKFNNNDRIGCIGGPEFFHSDDSFFIKCSSFSVTSFLTTGGIRGKRGTKFGKYYPRGFNMSIPMKVFKEVNGFDANFRFGEDIELSCRIKERGYDLAYAPDALVYHKRRGTIKKNIWQLFTMAAYRIAVVKVHKIALEPIYFLPSAILLSGFILIVGSFFSGTLFSITKWFYIGILSYLLAVGFAGVLKLKDLRAFFMVPFIFVIHQVSYSIGFIYGLLKLIPKRKTTS